jgi:hypothetical protein
LSFERFGRQLILAARIGIDLAVFALRTTPSLHFRPSLPRRGRASAAIIASRVVLFSAIAMATLFP